MKEAKTLKIITDASVIKKEGKYRGRAGIAVLDEDTTLQMFSSFSLGNVTSNEGEYLAMLQGLENTISSVEKSKGDTSTIKLELYTDSQLVFNQLLGNFSTKKAKFVQIQKGIKQACKKFKSSKIIWHERNRDLATLADFASKHPRRTKSIEKQCKGNPVIAAVTKAALFVLKDDEASKLKGKI